MSALTPDETLLGLLVIQPQHGYQLLEVFHDANRLGKVWNLSTSQLYAVLKRLERENWIIGQQVASDFAPTRTEYTLTVAGKLRLEVWLNEPHPSASIRRIRVEFLSRLYIAHLLELPTHLIIQRQRQACIDERIRISHRADTNASGVGKWASELVIAQIDAVLQWIDRGELILYRTQS